MNAKNYVKNYSEHNAGLNWAKGPNDVCYISFFKQTYKKSKTLYEIFHTDHVSPYLCHTNGSVRSCDADNIAYYMGLVNAND